MSHNSLIVNQDFIKENNHKELKKWPKYFIHKRLECYMCICQSKWHDNELKIAMMGTKSHFMNIINIQRNFSFEIMGIDEVYSHYRYPFNQVNMMAH